MNTRPINILVLFWLRQRDITDVIKCKQMGRSLKACFQSNEGNMIQHMRGSEKFKLSTKSGHLSAREDIVGVCLCSVNFTTTVSHTEESSMGPKGDLQTF
jgi:hypothetical protein